MASKFSNPNDLVFPPDQYGITGDLKKEFLRVVGRVGGDDEKLKTVNETLKVLLKHKDARHKDMKQFKGSKSNVEDHVAAREQVNTGGGDDTKFVDASNEPVSPEAVNLDTKEPVVPMTDAEKVLARLQADEDKQE